MSIGQELGHDLKLSVPHGELPFAEWLLLLSPMLTQSPAAIILTKPYQ